MTTCGAKTRAGTPCKQTAGWGTDHPGEGRCKLHGGATPIKHGLRSTVPSRYRLAKNPDLRALVEQYEKDPDPLGVFSELAILRAMLHQRLERMGEAGHLCPTCRRPSDEDGVQSLVEGISKATHRIERMRSANAISRPELYRIMSEMALVVAANVGDKATVEKITEGWLSIVTDGRIQPEGRPG